VYLGLEVVEILFQRDCEASVVPVLPADGIDRLPGVFSGVVEVRKVREEVRVSACWVPAPDPELSGLGRVVNALCRSSLTKMLLEVPQIVDRTPAVWAWYRSPDPNLFCLVDICWG
jgi:hypothetical protein